MELKTQSEDHQSITQIALLYFLTRFLPYFFLLLCLFSFFPLLFSLFLSYIRDLVFSRLYRSSFPPYSFISSFVSSFFWRRDVIKWCDYEASVCARMREKVRRKSFNEENDREKKILSFFPFLSLFPASFSLFSVFFDWNSGWKCYLRSSFYEREMKKDSSER